MRKPARDAISSGFPRAWVFPLRKSGLAAGAGHSNQHPPQAVADWRFNLQCKNQTNYLNAIAAPEVCLSHPLVWFYRGPENYGTISNTVPQPWAPPPVVVPYRLPAESRIKPALGSLPSLLLLLN